MDFIFELIKLVFTMVQFTNIVLSCILIFSGIALFRYIKQALRGFDRWIHLIVVLQVAVCLLLLSIYEVKSAETVIKTALYSSFAYQFSIFALLVINALFQSGIYKFFSEKHCDVTLLGNILKIIHSQSNVSVKPSNEGEASAT
jgi:hypothetical protein